MNDGNGGHAIQQVLWCCCWWLRFRLLAYMFAEFQQYLLLVFRNSQIVVVLQAVDEADKREERMANTNNKEGVAPSEDHANVQVFFYCCFSLVCSVSLFLLLASEIH